MSNNKGSNAIRGAVKRLGSNPDLVATDARSGPVIAWENFDNYQDYENVQPYRNDDDDVLFPALRAAS